MPVVSPAKIIYKPIYNRIASISRHCRQMTEICRSKIPDVFLKINPILCRFSPKEQFTARTLSVIVTSNLSNERKYFVLFHSVSIKANDFSRQEIRILSSF